MIVLVFTANNKGVKFSLAATAPINNQFISLSCQDSNPNKQSQNLMCYRYTTGQCFEGAKVLLLSDIQKFFETFLCAFT